MSECFVVFRLRPVKIAAIEMNHSLEFIFVCACLHKLRFIEAIKLCRSVDYEHIGAHTSLCGDCSDYGYQLTSVINSGFVEQTKTLLKIIIKRTPLLGPIDAKRSPQFGLSYTLLHGQNMS